MMSGKKTHEDHAPWWRKAADALPSGDFKLSVPLHVMFGEATDLAGFMEKYWEPELGASKQVVRPGLSVLSKLLPRETGRELLDLVVAGQGAQTAYVLAVNGPTVAAKMERAEFVAGEIESALEVLFDDGVEDEKDAQLANVQNEHKNDPSSADALASELADWTALGKKYRVELGAVGDFDPAILDEGEGLEKALRAHDPNATSPEASRALGERNRILTMIQARMNLVRSRARWVFRNHPEILRKATSSYERRRRAESRRKKEQASQKPLAEGAKAIG